MKEVGRYNVTKDQTDIVFDRDHSGISIGTMAGKSIEVVGFIIYDNEDGSYHLKVWDKDERDYYTSSQVFIKNFIKYMKLFEDLDAAIPVEVSPVEIKSNKGRSYLSFTEAPSAESNNDAWRNLNI